MVFYFSPDLSVIQEKINTAGIFLIPNIAQNQIINVFETKKAAEYYINDLLKMYPSRKYAIINADADVYCSIDYEKTCEQDNKCV